MKCYLEDYLYPKLHYRLLYPDALAPQVAHLGEDTGYDLYAHESKIIQPHATEIIGTGIGIEFDPRCGGRIGTRSSTAKLALIAIGGEIDAGYRGEVKVILHNLSDVSIPVIKFNKIAQLIAVPEVVIYNPVEVKELSYSSRGKDGFGSTGK